MKKIIAIDGNALLFKAYFATKYVNIMKTSEGVYTNALYSFISMITKVQNEMTYDYFLVAFDASSKTFRHQDFKEYKGTRSKTDEELVMQFPLVREYLNLNGIPNYEVEGYEADDIIGTIAKQGSNKNYEVDIISSDKDLLQLIDKNVSVLLSKQGVTNFIKITPDNLNTIWDITPKQVIDLKGLMGDPSDNIPGVKGIGEKTALKLIKEYDSIENVYQNIEDLKGKQKEKLIDGKESAFMSKELATIITDVSLPFELEELVTQEADLSKLKDFYHRYELKHFLSKIQNKTAQECEFIFETVTKLSAEMLLDNSFIDLISLNEYYHKDIIIGLAIVNEMGNFFIKTNDFIKDEEVLTFLKETSKYTYDLKKNILLGYWHGLELANFVEDVLIGSYLIDSNVKLDADALVDTNFHISTMNNKELLKQEAGVQIENKVKQAYYLNKLVELNNAKLKTNELIDLYKLELKIAYILADMEKTGILLDREQLEQINKDYQAICDRLENEIYGYAKKEFNINSVKQLGEVLFEDLNLRVIKKTKTGYSTDNDVLNELINDHPIIESIISYRTYKKLLSTYIIPMPDFILSDQRIHTIYNQCLTATGRLSSKEPNLQNIATKSDIQRSIKKSFIAKEGYSLLSFDYSQIELRILASFSKDPVFLDAFKHNFDIHRITAAKAAGVSEDEVTPEQRAAAKAINFGIVYGISDFGLARQLGIMRNEAKDFIEKYYQTYPNIKKYLDDLVKSCQETGYCRTILNRIRYIKDINSNNYNIREGAKRMAMNTPIQGSAADVLKLAMVNINEKLKKNNWDIKMLLQVHDELIFEVKDEDIENVSGMIADEMKHAYQMDVDFDVHCSTGKTWYDL